MSASSSHPSGRAGFSLVELVVASLVLSVALLLATQILRDSHRFSTLAQDELVRPDSGVATARLRADVRGARSFRGRALLSPLSSNEQAPRSSQPQLVSGAFQLELRGGADQGRGMVSYRLEQGQLIRRSVDRSGAQLSAGVALSGVRSFRWRRMNARLLRIELEVGPAGRPSTPGSRPVTQKLTLFTALRNVPSSTW